MFGAGFFFDFVENVDSANEVAFSRGHFLVAGKTDVAVSEVEGFLDEVGGVLLDGL